MRLITTPIGIRDAFETLLEKYNDFYCCDAWAGAPNSFPVGKLLKGKYNNIKKCVVGLHFCQTHPDFIKTFIHHKGVRFIKESEGVFHNKVYLFLNTPKDWGAIVGSSNFTRGGFEINHECNVLFSNDDDNNGKIYKSLMNLIQSIWDEASYFTNKDLDNYRDSFNKQQPHLDNLKKANLTPKNLSNEASLLKMTWDEYCSKLQKHNEQLKDRLNILNEAHTLFKSTKHFYDLDEYEKKEDFRLSITKG